MENIALVIFTIFIQASIGIILFVAIGRFLHKEKTFKNAIIVAAGLGIIGMIFSLLHLGQPQRAMNALYHFSSSWLSREIWFTTLFVGFIVLSTLFMFNKQERLKLVDVLLSVAAIIGLIDVYIMSSIYSTTSVPFWHGGATFIEFYATTISIGAVCFLLLSMKEVDHMRTLLVVTVPTVVILQVAAVVHHLMIAGTSSNDAMQSSIGILVSMPIVNALKWILILAGTVLFVWLHKKEFSPTIKSVVVCSACLLVAGQIIGRYLFYTAMVTTGIYLY